MGLIWRNEQGVSNWHCGVVAVNRRCHPAGDNGIQHTGLAGGLLKVAPRFVDHLGVGVFQGAPSAGFGLVDGGRGGGHHIARRHGFAVDVSPVAGILEGGEVGGAEHAGACGGVVRCGGRFFQASVAVGGGTGEVFEGLVADHPRGIGVAGLHPCRRFIVDAQSAVDVQALHGGGGGQGVPHAKVAGGGVHAHAVGVVGAEVEGLVVIGAHIIGVGVGGVGQVVAEGVPAVLAVHQGAPNASLHHAESGPGTGLEHGEAVRQSRRGGQCGHAGDQQALAYGADVQQALGVGGRAGGVDGDVAVLCAGGRGGEQGEGGQGKCGDARGHAACAACDGAGGGTRGGVGVGDPHFAWGWVLAWMASTRCNFWASERRLLAEMPAISFSASAGCRLLPKQSSSRALRSCSSWVM